ncbi:hypothetical protein A2Z23_02560 [Candidatus Curtissbacteria bacterium RBG_16_39_7]|uniref:Uncharacterized protein n=1 Tax=Candidatus Curtissbacteria bacterium RBG_16_39_7 TaxID=1797707 RepID=A0A1F5G361_9BACT|nr:MAG: hypothetical protein A2Z23_02560 [Candidatus Curtissbacteria bacterium RBG_16_39_7]
MRSNLEKNVLAALSYSDIFDYPLTQTQIHKFLVGKKASRKDVEENLKKLSAEKKIDQNREFYFLPKREKITETRIERELISQDKLKIAKKTARILKLIPSVKFVGISGALACKNSQKEDDIDFFIITKAGQVWTTRLLCTLILDILRKRRKRQDKKIKDKICLNLFLDESDLALGPKDLFLAREITQLKPLYDKNSCYQRFLFQNVWIKKFLPNTKVELGIKEQKSKDRLDFWSVFSILEPFLRIFQLFYMRERVTCEKLSKKQIFFHPVDVRDRILSEYNKRINQLPS